MAEELVIQGSALGKQFGENVIAVEDANFTIPRGSFISLVGPSGCGKSTLLRLISGLIEKSGGDLLVRNAEVVGPRSDIGMMFQKAVLLDWRTSIENVLLPDEIRGTIDTDAKKASMGPPAISWS